MFRHARKLAVAAAVALTCVVAPTASASSSVAVSGSAHVQNLGWLPATDGTIGTTGRSLRLEALRLEGPMHVRVHVQNIGWMPWRNMLHNDIEPTYVGTTGRSLRLEAIQIMLDPTWEAGGAHIEYRCHVQNIGWTPWVRDGKTCGTTGRSLRMEAIQVRMVSDPPPAPAPAPAPAPEPTPEPTPSVGAEG